MFAGGRAAPIATALAIAAGVVLGGAPRAHAESMQEQARAHYDMGTGAYVRADYKTAAQEFALADRLSPSAVALTAALDAAVQAELGPLAMELVARAARGPADPPLAALVTKARGRFAKRVGRVRVVCSPAPCAASLDGAPIELGAEEYAWIGRHNVRLERAAGVSERPVDISAEGRVDLVVTETTPASVGAPTPSPTGTPSGAPTPSPTGTPSPAATSIAIPAKAKAPAATDSGLSPAVFFTGVGVSVVLGAVTLASGLDTARKHDDYFSAHCEALASAACASRAQDGVSAQHRTNVLLASTAVVATATTLIGVAFTRWHASASAQVVGSAATAQLRIAWP